MISSIDPKLRRQKYPFKIFKLNDNSNKFQLSRDALHAKQKSLKRLGKGNKPNKSSPYLTKNLTCCIKREFWVAEMQKHLSTLFGSTTVYYLVSEVQKKTII